MPTTIPTITPLSTPPSRADAANFAARGDTFLGSLPTLVTETNAAIAAIQSVGTESATAADTATAAANAAANAAGVTVWLSGFSYNMYDPVIDPVDYKTYRAKNAISSATRPGLDAVNWAVVYGQGDVFLNGTPVAYRNKILNGSFNITQRATTWNVNNKWEVSASYSSLGANTYTVFDRWKTGAGAGGGYSVSSVFETENSGISSPKTVTITAGTLKQTIEATMLPAGTYYVSWVGTAQGRINTGSYSSAPFSFVADGVSNYVLEFNTGTLTNVQVEAGAVTPFEQRPAQLELFLCQRYYWRGNHIGVGVLLFDKYGTASDQLVGLILEVVPVNHFRVAPVFTGGTGDISWVNVSSASILYRNNGIYPSGTLTATGRAYAVTTVPTTRAFRLDADF